MRIAQLANFIGPASGGMKTAVAALGRGYVEAGASRLLVVPGPTDAVTSTPEGDVVQLRAPRVGGGYRLIVEPWRVIDVLERFAPTSVELSDKLTLLPVTRWARRNGVRSVLFSHERLDDMLAMRTGLDAPSKVSVALLNRLLVRSFDTVVVTSSYAREEFAALADAAGCPLVQVPLGVDLETFHPTRVEGEGLWGEWSGGGRVSGDGSGGDGVGGDGVQLDGSGGGVLRLAHVGRLSREKSPHLAVATAVELHRRGVPVRLDVYGEGPHLAELQALAGPAPVTFHGFVEDRAELNRRIGAADLALSGCPGETFGLAVLEALAAGTPVVTASRGGARELVGAGSGAWGDPDPGSLADAVLALAGRDVPALRAGARRRAELFPWSETVARMLEVHAAGALVGVQLGA